MHVHYVSVDIHGSGESGKYRYPGCSCSFELHEYLQIE